MQCRPYTRIAFAQAPGRTRLETAVIVQYQTSTEPGASMTASSKIRHLIGVAAPGKYAGWPANSGMWHWGNELLFGFAFADHQDKESGHTYNRETSRQRFARSLDGGETWQSEDAVRRGITARAKDHEPGPDATEPQACPGGFDCSHPGFAVTFRRTSDADGPSHFYVTVDRGQRWQGPYALPLFGQPGILARTDYLVEDRCTLLAMLTASKRNGREGRVGCVRTRDGGASWQWVSWLDEEPDGFAIMPSTVRLGPASLLCAVRRREAGRNWLAAYRSDDHAATWRRTADPTDDTGPGGNPPALIRLTDGRLCVGYAVRSRDPHNPSRVCVRFSSDDGAGWDPEVVLRHDDGANADVGYVRMVQRPDGHVVMAYYYNHACRDAPAYRYIAVTIFDPDDL